MFVHAGSTCNDNSEIYTTIIIQNDSQLIVNSIHEKCVPKDITNLEDVKYLLVHFGNNRMKYCNCIIHRYDNGSSIIFCYSLFSLTKIIVFLLRKNK